MLNTQVRERRSANATLEVHSIWETIQGEGPFAGMPAVFVRLAGCNLQCPLCDTDYTSKRHLMTPADVVSQVQSTRASGLVVITGGEPFRQNIGPVVDLLDHYNYPVQVETNGTLWRYEISTETYEKMVLVCSPKSPVHKKFYDIVRFWKYVIKTGEVSPEDGLPTKALDSPFEVARPTPFTMAYEKRNIFIQPADEDDPVKNEHNLKTTIMSCLRFGYRFSLQVHKYIGLD
jgi:7-carboxy-7-deazaguanine synthase